jgi:hypothetical protein
MRASDASSRPVRELIRRAAATSLDSARIIERSVELLMRSIEGAQNVARTCRRVEAARGEILRTNRLVRQARSQETRHLAHVGALPLTPSKLLEVAEEFRAMAGAAATPECRSAFEDLVLRYTALAAGYDNQQAGSRTLH